MLQKKKKLNALLELIVYSLLLGGASKLMLKGHRHAVLVHFKNKKYVLTPMNAHK